MQGLKLYLACRATVLASWLCQPFGIRKRIAVRQQGPGVLVAGVANPLISRNS
jgi:hypothetical protein